MPAWDFSRSISSLRLMIEFAQARGLQPAELLSGTRVRPEQLSDPGAEITAEQELRLIRNLVAATGDPPALGIELGQRYQFTVFGVLGFAMISSRSMREALDIGLRYFHLTFAFTQFSVEETGTQTLVSLDDSEIPPPLRRFIVERDIAAFITLQRDIFGDERVLENLSFRFDPPAQVEPFSRFFGLMPEFRAARHGAIFDRARLSLPLPKANDVAQQMAETQCRQILDARRRRSGLSARVRSCIANSLQQGATMQAIAEDLHMIPRTLRRRLQEEGTSYAELRDEVRQALADEFLSGPRLSIEQIAARLGYAEATSFVNAFKRWRGTTPHAARLRPASATS